MVRSSPYTSILCKGLIVFLFFSKLAVLAQENFPSPNLIAKERARRVSAQNEGQILVEKGDQAYQAGEYLKAKEAFAGAIDLISDAPQFLSYKNAVKQRFALASVQYARELKKSGDLEGAKKAVDFALSENFTPEDELAKSIRSELNDPLETNPADTSQHEDNVRKVTELLYLASGAFDLAKWDEAYRHYEQVLRIDPHNLAARRGMEKIAAEKSEYADSARDHTRAELLAGVDQAWELPKKSNLDVPVLSETGQEDAQGNLTIPLSSKVKKIIITDYQIKQGNLLEAVELLELRSKENDELESDPQRKGINIAVNLSDAGASSNQKILDRTFDISVKNVPVVVILEYITRNTGTSFRVDDFAVNISDKNMDSEVFSSRTYRVPPDFLSQLSASNQGGGSEKSDDVFNTEASSGGILATHLGAKEALAMQGVNFPEGSSAQFNPSSNLLRVVNTLSNLELIDQIVDSIAQTEPVSIAVSVKILKVEKNRLEELGFDWMLSDFQNESDHWRLFGGSVGNGSELDHIINGSTEPTSPITAGNRSGDGMFQENSLDTIIAAGSQRNAQNSERAPGVLGFNGVINEGVLQSLMRGLDQKGGADIMAQPSITTRSGQAANVYVVDELIYPTEYEPPKMPQSVGVVNGIDVGYDGTPPITPATPTAFEKKDTGIFLEVLPVADENKRYVNVTLNPTMTDFDGFVNYGSPINNTAVLDDELNPSVITENAILMPIFSTKKTSTNVDVADGSTIVIGGLLKDEIVDVEDEAPILGKIPFAGRLFQSKGTKQVSTAILFFVNVELLDPTGRPYRDR